MSKSRIDASLLISLRYSRAAVASTFCRFPDLKPRWRAATTTLAASRLTSHSNGPGRVSSKSLMSKMRRRSGAVKAAEVREVRVAAELDREAGVGAAPRSAAMIAAAPR